MIYYSDSDIAARHGLQPGPTLRDMALHYHRMAHRHRLELIGAGTWEEAQGLRGTLTGEAFLPAAGYHGPGEGVGNGVFSIHTYGRDLPADESGYRIASDRWVTWLQQHAPGVEYFLYLTDEPKATDEERVRWIAERARWIHQNPGPGRKLPVLVTAAPNAGMVGSVDIWCTVTSRYPPGPVAAARDRDERVWLYCGIRPQTPTDMIDEHGISFRLKPWMAYRHAISRWFTWQSTHWFPNHNEQPNDRPKDIFSDPATFTVGTPAGTGNGDGTLFYPGQDRLFPDQDRGCPGPISSIRMKMYRRGSQDVEYMWLASEKGHRVEVDALTARAAPDSMWQPSPTPRWSTANADYELVRRRLAELLAGS
jgi:hypothetical protein